jgi:hypothetical protein
MTGTPVPNMIVLNELTAALEQLRDQRRTSRSASG